MEARWVALAQVMVFLAVAIGWRASVQYRRSGTTGIVMFRGVSAAEMARDLVFMSAPAVLLALALVPLALPPIPPPWGWIQALDGAVPRNLGVVLTAAGTLLMVVAQLQMGKSWRIGIDDGARPGLVTSGFYGFCRNPIYLFFFVWGAGFTLVVPTGLSLLVLALVIVCVHVQVLREEAYLIRSYGEEYRRYAARVGRYFPGVGLLADAGTGEGDASPDTGR